MEVGCHVVIVAGFAEDQVVIRLGHQRGVEVEHAVLGRRAGRGDAQQRQPRHLGAKREGLLPDVQHRMRAQRDQDARTAGVQQPGAAS